MATKAEVLKAVNLCDEDDELAFAIWCTEDVTSHAEYLGIPCTPEQAKAVMHLVHHKQDCTIGISWDTIEMYLKEVLEAEKEDQEEDERRQQCPSIT